MFSFDLVLVWEGDIRLYLIGVGVITFEIQICKFLNMETRRRFRLGAPLPRVPPVVVPISIRLRPKRRREPTAEAPHPPSSPSLRHSADLFAGRFRSPSRERSRVQFPSLF